ncbi:MAG: hypothetical protein ACYTGC_17635 [Planctomycetota bacterium]|jgi:hypothetical protein
MSKSTAHQRRRKSRPEAKSKPAPDHTIYAGLIMIGVFVVLLSIPLLQGDHWPEVAVGYLAAMAYLANLYAFRAYRGAHLANWQGALARIPLRFVGFGGGGGKPIEAARGHARAAKAIVVSIVVSLVIIVVAAILLVPTLRPF